MNAALIYTYCEVIADRRLADGHRAIYFIDGGRGYVQTDIREEGEYLSYSCASLEEFEDIVEML